MATPTYDPIASTTLASSASSVTFSSIPQGYRDLVLVMKPISTTASGYGGTSWFIINGDSGGNYPYVVMRGTGSSAVSQSGATQSVIPGVYKQTSSYTPSYTAQIMDYSVTDKHKSVLVRADVAEEYTEAWACRWNNTSAVTQIDIQGGDFAAGSVFSLYGIAA